MKQLSLLLLFLGFVFININAQLKLTSPNFNSGSTSNYIYGVRVGLNIANVSNRSSIGANNRLGFMAGAYADNSFGRFFGFRHEMTYSRQGFNFKNPKTSGKVDLQYIYATSLLALNLGHIFQAHAGPQVGFLINALADTINNLNSGNVSRFFSVTGQTNRLTYGGCAGFEVYPWKGLLDGARNNLSFSSINKSQDGANVYIENQLARRSIYTQEGNRARLRSEMWQIVFGWRWGGKFGK